MEETFDNDFDEGMRDAAESGAALSQDRAQRYYDRIRSRIQKYLENKGGVVEKTAEFLLLVPDVFILLWRLANDSRVNGKNKVLLGTSIAYYLFPFDIIPEAIVGPMGYMDDLVFGVYVLNKILGDTDAQVLREHWSGSEDVLTSIQKVLGAAETLVSSEMLNRLKALIGRNKQKQTSSEA
jgi:uncharacterized membrane protein YkvA (DUF1232 family)